MTTPSQVTGAQLRAIPRLSFLDSPPERHWHAAQPRLAVSPLRRSAITPPFGGGLNSISTATITHKLIPPRLHTCRKLLTGLLRV